MVSPEPYCATSTGEMKGRFSEGHCQCNALILADPSLSPSSASSPPPSFSPISLRGDVTPRALASNPSHMSLSLFVVASSSRPELVPTPSLARRPATISPLNQPAYRHAIAAYAQPCSCSRCNRDGSSSQTSPDTSVARSSSQAHHLPCHHKLAMASVRSIPL